MPTMRTVEGGGVLLDDYGDVELVAHGLAAYGKKPRDPVVGDIVAAAAVDMPPPEPVYVPDDVLHTAITGYWQRANNVEQSLLKSMLGMDMRTMASMSVYAEECQQAAEVLMALRARALNPATQMP